jgi:hypothetical protein
MDVCHIRAMTATFNVLLREKLISHVLLGRVEKVCKSTMSGRAPREM